MTCIGDKTANEYKYIVQIINPKRKSEFKTMTWHDVKHRFSSVTSLKTKLVECYPSELSEDLKFDVGYYQGRESTKRWLVDDRDLNEMYKNNEKTTINLWCEGIFSQDETPPCTESMNY